MHKSDITKDNIQPKKNYKSPVMHIYGNIEKMTQSLGKNGMADGGNSANRKNYTQA